MAIASYIRDLINHIIDFFYPPFKRFLPIETFRYAATGGGNMVLDILLYFVFFHFVVGEKIFSATFFGLFLIVGSILFQGWMNRKEA
jgi:hypothetical protein